MIYDSAEAWFAAFCANPEKQLVSFLRGVDKIAPYFQESSAAATLWYILPKAHEPDYSDRTSRIDAALLPWAQHCVQSVRSEAHWNLEANKASNIIDLLRSLPLPTTAQWMLGNWQDAGAWAEFCTRPTSEDLYVALLGTLRRYSKTKCPGHAGWSQPA